MRIIRSFADALTVFNSSTNQVVIPIKILLTTPLMSTYTLLCHENSLAESEQVERYWYLLPEYLGLHTSEGLRYFSIVDDSSCRLVVSAAFVLQNTHAYGARFAPFGGIQLHVPLSEDALCQILRLLEDALWQEGIKAIYLTPSPTYYLPSPISLEFWKKTGYELLQSTPIHYLEIHPQLSLYEQMAPAHRRRLRKCQEAGFVAEEWRGFCPKTVYEWLHTRRIEKGYSMSLSFEAFQHQVSTFPERYLVYRVLDGSRLAALSVSVRVASAYLYHFLPAHHPDYVAFSPVVQLTNALYSYCIEAGIRILDLGISVDGSGNEKHSLMRFKRNLGARASSRYHLRKIIRPVV